MQVDARFLPPALHRALRHAMKRRDFGEGKTAEELEVDDLGFRAASPSGESGKYLCGPLFRKAAGQAAGRARASRSPQDPAEIPGGVLAK